MKLWLMIFSMMCASLVSAQTSTFLPGEYLTERGWGLLEIKPAQQGRQKFDINALGTNGSVCILDGEIYQGKATLIDEHDKSRCDISFKAKGTDIDVVMTTSETCRGYCGWNAGFEAVYLKPTPGCDNASRAHSRSSTTARTTPQPSVPWPLC